MKNIFLSVVVICALVIAGVGGTLATLSDTEESFDNYIEIGSLDLKVNDNDDYNEDWNQAGGIGAVIQAECIVPDTMMGSLVKVENEGCVDGYLYMIVKNNDCYNTLKEGAEGWFPDPQYDPIEYKPEPEMVAEFGGMLAQQCLDGRGVVGDNCCMNSHVWVTGVMTERPIYPAGSGTPFIDDVLIGSLQNSVRYIGELPKCGGNWYLHFYFDVPQESERDLSMDPLFSEGNPFTDWPANALQADGINFDILFILVDHELTADEKAAIVNDLP